MLRGRNYPTLTYSYQPDIDDVTIGIETTSDLLNWSSDTTLATGDPIPQPDGKVEVTFRTTLPMNTSAPLYIRLRVRAE